MNTQNSTDRAKARSAARVREQTTEYKARKAEYYQKNKLKKRLYDIEWRYGLKPEAYLAMLETQRNACAICEDKFEKEPHVDHDHATGAVRGLLCDHCNVMLSRALDSPIRLRLGADYLERCIGQFSSVQESVPKP